MRMLRHGFENMNGDTVLDCLFADTSFDKFLLFELAKHLVPVFGHKHKVPEVQAHFVGITF